MSQTAPNPPEAEFRAGLISAAIWPKEVERDGRQVVQYSVRVQKRYYDQTSRSFKTTEYFFPDDLPRLQLVAAKAYEYVMLRTRDAAEDFPAPQPAAAP